MLSRHTTGAFRAQGSPRRVFTIRLVLSVLTVVAITCVARTVKLAPNPDGDKSDESYSSQISRTYDFKFGPNPFAPGNATTTTGTFIPGDMFVLAKRCGTCHTDAHAQWRQSAHGNAFREPFYQKNVKDLQSQKGVEFESETALRRRWRVVHCLSFDSIGQRARHRRLRNGRAGVAR